MTDRPHYGILTAIVILSIAAGIWQGAMAGIGLFVWFMAMVVFVSLLHPGNNGEGDITKATPPDPAYQSRMQYDQEHPLYVIRDEKGRRK